VGEIDARWHDVTAIRLWLRTSRNESGNTRIEPDGNSKAGGLTEEEERELAELMEDDL